MKLELKHIAPYLPYGLKWSLQELKIFSMSGITEETLYTNEGNVFNWTKHSDLPQALFPILRPLSDLTKEIEVNGKKFVPVDFIKNQIMKERGYTNYDMTWLVELQYKNLYKIKLHGYWLFEQLFEWHFDCFELLSNGLAIDINTIK